MEKIKKIKKLKKDENYQKNNEDLEKYLDSSLVFFTEPKTIYYIGYDKDNDVVYACPESDKSLREFENKYDRSYNYDPLDNVQIMYVSITNKYPELKDVDFNYEMNEDLKKYMDETYDENGRLKLQDSEMYKCYSYYDDDLKGLEEDASFNSYSDASGWIWNKIQNGFVVKCVNNISGEEEVFSDSNVEDYEDITIKDSKKINNVITNIINYLETNLKSAYNYSEQLKEQVPKEQPTTNEEKTLYNGNDAKIFEEICNNIKSWYKKLEEYKQKLSTAHIVEEEVLESFPLDARTKLRESENPEETYKELIEELKNKYNSLPDKEKYKEQVVKMKKDLDEFYKNTFKK